MKDERGEGTSKREALRRTERLKGHACLFLGEMRRPRGSEIDSFNYYGRQGKKEKG